MWHKSGCTVKTLRTPQHRALVAELRRVRLAAGLTQAVLAARLGVAQSFVAKVENAERRLDVVEFAHWMEASEAFEQCSDVLERVRGATAVPSR
ncbi:helix-turn-helix transcriptional regulator [Marivita sp.]|uniref:helix-turn-helix domain-containing protein n=1 Tax=Marivita sp. TaxID=2003365 RepID=UPI00345582F3